MNFGNFGDENLSFANEKFVAIMGKGVGNLNGGKEVSGKHIDICEFVYLCGARKGNSAAFRGLHLREFLN